MLEVIEMDTNKSIKILEALANGIDPTTGEKFPAHSPYSNPEVIRGLYHALEIIRKHKQKSKMTLEEKQQANIYKGLPRNTSLPWRDEQREYVATNFKQGETVDQLASKLERTRGAIIAELERQNIISREEARDL